MALRACCTACLRHLFGIVFSRECLRATVLARITLSACLSYYAYQFGFWIGALSRTPELASIHADLRVWFDTVTPQDLRWHAWLLLWSSVAVMLHCGWLVLKTVVEDQNAQTRPDSALSPNLPYQSLLRPSVTQDATDDYRMKRSSALSRALWILPIFVLALAFLKKQHVGSTLVYHPVTSPLLLPYSDDLREIPRLETLGSAQPEEVFNLDSDAKRPLYSSAATMTGDSVPNILHFVFGMDATFGGKPFGFAHYLSMYSAMVETRPEKVMFWYHFLPSSAKAPNWWFDRIRADAVELDIAFEPVVARDFDSIFGNPVKKFAHKADVLRLEALLAHGGIYLDLDVYTIRSFAPLLRFPTVLGIEGGVENLPIQGLCNGIIVAQKNATFIRRWYESYKDFKDDDWAGLSVKLPLQLAMHHPEELLVLDPYAMFYPGWNNHGLRLVHSRAAASLGEAWDFFSSHQFAYHAWSSFTTEKWLNKLTPGSVWEQETGFSLLLRRWTSQKLIEDWKDAKKAGLV